MCDETVSIKQSIFWRYQDENHKAPEGPEIGVLRQVGLTQYFLEASKWEQFESGGSETGGLRQVG